MTVKADDNGNRKELNCKVQEDASGVKKQKYFKITRADIESLGSENGYFSITEISVNGKTYEAPGTKNLNGLFPVYVDMEYQPGNQTGSTSNGVFYVGNYTKDQDVVLEFHHKNEIQTVLEISIPKGTQKYLLTEEDMKSLTEGEEYSYCIRQAGDRHAVLLRSKQRVEEGFEAAGISMTGYPATPSTTVTLEYGDSTAKLFYCVMTEQNFQSKYDYQTELVPDNQWIAYAGAFTPFAGMTKSGTMMILTKVVNAAGTKAKYAYYDVEVRAGAGNDQDDDHKDDNGDKGNSNGTNSGNQGNNGNQNTNNGNQNTDGTLAVGTVKEVKGQKYKVLSASTVAFVGVINGKTKKVNIPKTVQINKKTYKVVQIAKNALKGSDVQTVVIGANVTAIQDQAFAGCKKLKKVTVGANVKSIGKAAFKDCKNLKNITVKSTKLKTVKANALKGINKKCDDQGSGKETQKLPETVPQKRTEQFGKNLKNNNRIVTVLHRAKPLRRILYGTAKFKEKRQNIKYNGRAVHIKERKKRQLFLQCFFFLHFWYGGFYEFSGAMLAAVLGILLIVCRVKYSFQIKGKKSAGSVAVCVFMVRYYLFLCNRSGNGFCGRDQNAATASWLSVFSCSFRMKPDRKQQAISHTSAALWYWPGFWHCHFRL